MSNSTKARPIRNGQTIPYQYTFRNARTGDPVDITGMAVTYVIRRRSAAYSGSTGTVTDGPNGVCQADILFSLSDISEEGEAVNVQFFADGLSVPGQPQPEWVSPSVSEIADTSKTILKF